MSRYRTRVLFAALALLFFFANRAAFKGYFAADDLDNLSWLRYVPLPAFVAALLSPEFFANNFRPVGHGFERVVWQAAGLHFPVYVAASQLLHGFNCLLLWRLLGRLGFRWEQAAAGVTLFAFHAACFEIYWRPMSVFDLLCTTFCLAALLAWTRSRWLFALALFWLAYKSKEIAIGLPVVLALYELWFGRRQWRRLAPFFAVSLLFGIQALLAKGGAQDVYGLHLSAAGVISTAGFYVTALGGLPYAALALLAIPLLTRDCRAAWGLAAAALFLAPMLALPDRRLAVYLYLPLTGIAIAFAALPRWPVAAAFLLLWMPAQYLRLREFRSTTLAEAAELRAYVTGLAPHAAAYPAQRSFLIDGQPGPLMSWGLEGALRLAFDAPAVTIRRFPQGPEGALLLSWDGRVQRLYAARWEPDEPPAAGFLTMDGPTPAAQLVTGWHEREHGHRWTAPAATLRLLRPAGAAAFRLGYILSPEHLQQAGGPLALSIIINGVPLPDQTLATPGDNLSLALPLPLAPAGPVTVTLAVAPALGGRLGLPITALGFTPASTLEK